MGVQRLDKIISSGGHYSRSEASALIRRGGVLVNGFPARSGADKADPDTDVITVEGIITEYRPFRYIMMNKPVGILSATEDRGGITALELLPEEYRKMRLSPAGRLDKASEGLLLLTNDGAYVHRVISPAKKVFKQYYVETEGALTAEDVTAVERGISLSDFTSLPGKMEILSSGEQSRAYVFIREGKYHQVRRMLGSLGKPVTCLKRVAIGALKLDETLAPGEYRELTLEETRLVFTEEQDDLTDS